MGAQEYRQALQRLLRVVEPMLRSVLDAVSLHPSSAEQAERRYKLDCRGGGPVVYGGMALELALLREAQRRIAGNSAANALEPMETVGAAGDGCPLTDTGSKILRLHRESWLILREALLGVIEAFVQNLMADGGDVGGGRGGYERRGARRLAHWLASADVQSLQAPGAYAEVAQLGLRCIVPEETPQQGRKLPPLFAFLCVPGLGACGNVLQVDQMPAETPELKIRILQALCGLCRQIVRIDPVSLEGLPSARQGRKVSFGTGVAGGHGSSRTRCPSSSSDEALPSSDSDD